uniref:Ovule protein n=1 Tax=Brugia timori TaxID=42155 RepID=A0A0R3QI20_9BILA
LLFQKLSKYTIIEIFQILKKKSISFKIFLFSSYNNYHSLLYIILGYFYEKLPKLYQKDKL